MLEQSVKLLKEALNDCTTVPTHLSQAIDITIKFPDVCEKISWWKEGLWEFIEEFLNTKPENINDEYFIQACALLH